MSNLRHCGVPLSLLLLRLLVLAVAGLRFLEGQDQVKTHFNALSGTPCAPSRTSDQIIIRVGVRTLANDVPLTLTCCRVKQVSGQIRSLVLSGEEKRRKSEGCVGDPHFEKMFLTIKLS